MIISHRPTAKTRSCVRDFDATSKRALAFVISTQRVDEPGMIEGLLVGANQRIGEFERNRVMR